MEIEINSLSFIYPNESKYILNDINLEIDKSSIVGIIGKNGSGKTTLLDILDGIIKPSKGYIKYDGNNFFNPKDIGYLIQNSQDSFLFNTVKEELLFSLKTHNYKLDNQEKRIKDVLKIVNLNKDILNRNPLTLSNSESKKLALASILIYNPKVLILDEPTLNLDSKSISDMITLIKKLKIRYNKTIIIVSHDIEFLHKLVDKIVVLSNGKIVLNNDKYSVFKDTKKIKKYGILPPKIILFETKVLNNKGIKLGYRDEINDLIKDIFRNV